MFTPAETDDLDAGNYERVKTTEFLLALRVLTAAYLDDKLFSGVFLSCFDLDYEIDTDLIFPKGSQQDSSPQALPTDKTVFATYHWYSDFDIATLVWDPEQLSQFFHWKEHVQSHHSKIVAHSNDILTGVTNEIGMRLVPFPHPLFLLKLSDIPRETMSHLEEIRRESPLVTADISGVLEQSKKFLLKIQDIITKGTQRGFYTVYYCEITSINDQPITRCPSLCLKLFDDQFQSLSMPEPQPTFGFKNINGQLQSFSIPDERDSAEFLHHLFYCMVFAEVCALTESLTYKKLQQVQGSVVPWFYGTHQVSYMFQRYLSCISMTPSLHYLMGLSYMVF